MIAVVAPKSPLLKKYIDNFTQLDFVAQPIINYYVFPQFGTSVALFKNAHLHTSGGVYSINASPNHQASVFVTGKYIVPIQLSFDNAQHIGINFKPNGVNAFFKQPFAKLAPTHAQFIINARWIKATNSVFKFNTFAHQVAAMEDALEKLFIEEPSKQIDKAVELLHNRIEMPIAEIAAEVGWSERSLNRNFNLYIGCSPRVYRRIVRFRNTIHSKFFSTQKLNLTELCFENGYFDSPHFTKEFKKLTGKSPRLFFKETTPIGAGKFPYHII